MRRRKRFPVHCLVGQKVNHRWKFVCMLDTTRANHSCRVDDQARKADLICMRHAERSCKDATEGPLLEIVRHEASYGILSWSSFDFFSNWLSGTAAMAREWGARCNDPTDSRIALDCHERRRSMTVECSVQLARCNRTRCSVTTHECHSYHET